MSQTHAHAHALPLLASICPQSGRARCKRGGELFVSFPNHYNGLRWWCATFRCVNDTIRVARSLQEKCGVFVGSRTRASALIHCRARVQVQCCIEGEDSGEYVRTGNVFKFFAMVFICILHKTHPYSFRVRLGAIKSRALSSVLARHFFLCLGHVVLFFPRWKDKWCLAANEDLYEHSVSSLTETPKPMTNQRHTQTQIASARD